MTCSRMIAAILFLALLTLSYADIPRPSSIFSGQNKPDFPGPHPSDNHPGSHFPYNQPRPTGDSPHPEGGFPGDHPRPSGDLPHSTGVPGSAGNRPRPTGVPGSAGNRPRPTGETPFSTDSLPVDPTFIGSRNEKSNGESIFSNSQQPHHNQNKPDLKPTGKGPFSAGARPNSAQPNGEVQTFMKLPTCNSEMVHPSLFTPQDCFSPCVQSCGGSLSINQIGKHIFRTPPEGTDMVCFLKCSSSCISSMHCKKTCIEEKCSVRKLEQNTCIEACVTSFVNPSGSHDEVSFCKCSERCRENVVDCMETVTKACDITCA